MSANAKHDPRSDPRSDPKFDPRFNPVNDFHELLHRFEERLPGFCMRWSRWLRKPNSWMVRYPVSVLLVLGGVFSFLPVLGIWMLPLGLMLIAVDWPPLRPPLARMLSWLERKWPPKKLES